MEPQSGFARFRELSDAAGRKVAETADTATTRVASGANDAQVAARQAAGRVATKAAEAREAVVSAVRPKRNETVDLTQLSQEAKLLYCRVLAHLARVDEQLDPREISNLYLFASTIGLGADGRSELRRETVGGMSAVRDEEAENAAIHMASDLGDLVGEADRGAVISMLVRDLVRIARADRHVADTERGKVVQIARVGFPDAAEELVEAAERLVAAEEQFATGRISVGQMESIAKDIAAKASAFGVPIAAISVGGSVAGLSASGITSGLAALGFGGLLGLSSMVTGIGVVVILGVGVHQGVRYLLGINERERANRREALIQQVLRNHQQAMSDLTDDIATLAGRMEEYLNQTTRNEGRLVALRAELAAFQQALVDLQISQKAFEHGEPVNAG